MVVNENELRTRLAQASTDDLDAVHALYLDNKKYQEALGHHGSLDNSELSRRIERKMAQTIRAAQERGEVLAHHASYKDHRGYYVKDLIPSPGMVNQLYLLADGVSDEIFDQAVAECRQFGSLGRKRLIVRIRRLRDAQQDKTVVSPTRRGHKTIEHMAISLNALAMGVVDLDAREVDLSEAREMVDSCFEDIGVIRSFLREVNAQ